MIRGMIRHGFWTMKSWGFLGFVFIHFPAKIRKKQKHYSLYMCLNRWKKQELNGMDNGMDHLISNRPCTRFGRTNVMHGARMSTKAFEWDLNVVQWLGIDCKTMSNVFTCKSWRNTAEESEDENLVLFQNRVPVNPMVFHRLLPSNRFFYEDHPLVTPGIPANPGKTSVFFCGSYGSNHLINAIHNVLPC